MPSSLGPSHRKTSSVSQTCSLTAVRIIQSYFTSSILFFYLPGWYRHPCDICSYKDMALYRCQVDFTCLTRNRVWKPMNRVGWFIWSRHSLFLSSHWTVNVHFSMNAVHAVMTDEVMNTLIVNQTGIDFHFILIVHTFNTQVKLTYQHLWVQDVTQVRLQPNIVCRPAIWLPSLLTGQNVVRNGTNVINFQWQSNKNVFAYLPLHCICTNSPNQRLLSNRWMC